MRVHDLPSAGVSRFRFNGFAMCISVAGPGPDDTPRFETERRGKPGAGQGELANRRVNVAERAETTSVSRRYSGGIATVPFSRKAGLTGRTWLTGD